MTMRLESPSATSRPKSKTTRKTSKSAGKGKRSSAKGRLPRVPATDRREQLIDATILVMRRDGVPAVTMRAVAKEAHASLAAVHYCFENKNALLEAAIQRWLKVMITDAVNASTKDGVRGYVRAMVGSYWTSFEETPEDILAQFELALWMVRGDETGSLASAIYPMYIAQFRSMLEKSLVLSGETCRWDVDRLARAILVVIDGCSLQYLSDRVADVRSLCNDLVEVLLIQAEISAVPHR